MCIICLDSMDKVMMNNDFNIKQLFLNKIIYQRYYRSIECILSCFTKSLATDLHNLNYTEKITHRQ